MKQRTLKPRWLLTSLLAALMAASGSVCPGISVPADPAIWAGCWRFAVRMGTADGTRGFVDRDFIVEIDSAGVVTRVAMRRQGESIEFPLDPAARFVDLISADAAAALQSSFYANRVSTNPANPSVRFESLISASTTGFLMNAALTLPEYGVSRYALNATITINSGAVTAVTGLFIDQADDRGVLQIQQLFTGAGRVASQVVCPSPLETVCDRFHEIGAALVTTRFCAVDPALGLAGQVCFASGNSIDLVDLATGGRRARVTLAAAVQGRMAVDVARRKLFATTRNAVGNNALAVIDLDSAAMLRTVELKPAGCIDFGTRGAAAVIPSTGEVLVTLSNSADTRFEGVARVEPVSGVVNGALQNVHLTSAAFDAPGDLVVVESRGVALVANAGAATVVTLPLTVINRDILGGDGSPCQEAVASTTLTTTATGGNGVPAIAVDEGDSRGIVLVQGATASDGAFQLFTIAGSGGTATITPGGSTPFGRRARAYGVELDPIRNEAYIVNGDADTFRIALPGGAVTTLQSIATGDLTGLASVPGRNRLIQAGANSFFGEYCLP